MSFIEVSELSKTYPGFRLDEISFTQEEGTIIGLLGENGAGKTTLIKLMLGAISDDGGTVNYFHTGKDASSVAIRQDIGFMLDENTQFDEFKVKEMAAVLRDVYEQWDDDLFAQHLKSFKLSKDQKIKTLSTGNKKKLFLAAAVSHHAKYLILDEPTSGLDPMTRDDIRLLLQDYLAKYEAAIMFSTHITSDLEDIADYLMFIHKGKMQIKGIKDDLLSRYALALMTKTQWEDLPKGGVINMRKSQYGIEALLDLASELYDETQVTFLEKPTIEKLMLFILREGDQ